MELNLAKISIRHSSFINRNSIKNLIFDFGGVICNIDVKLTEQAFMDLGLKRFDTGRSISDSAGLFEDLETGAIAPQHFRDELRRYFESPITDEQLDAAWNALLLDVPEPRIRLIEALRKNYRIFLLSNSNEIHYLKYNDEFAKQFGYNGLEGLFETAWFSFRIGMKKPDPAIFNYVMDQAELIAAETLFIDDTLQHVEGARAVGMHACHLKIGEGEEITDLFY
jgi:glucose-1-phosphatase